MSLRLSSNQFCPVCMTEVELSERYPDYICRDCAKKVKSADGRPVEFFVDTFRGNLVCRFIETSEEQDSAICYVDSVKCFASEARFGGIVIQTVRPGLFNKIKGGLIGLLVGDALGVPYEFHKKDVIPPQNQIEFEPAADFARSHPGVPPGTYSDDGAQALILLNTLLECGKFDPVHFADGLIDWHERGFMAVGGIVFDVGIQTTKSIRKLREGFAPLLAGGTDEYSNGNGSLMRVLPLALWHQGTDRELITDCFDQSSVTHGHIRSKICCGLYCLWARQILQNKENPWENAVRIFLDMFGEGTPERDEFGYKILPENATYDVRGSGYVVDSLRAALWANDNKNFESTVKSAVALGDDTDTTACIAGGIAGIRFGPGSIPRRWRENLRGREIYEPLLEKLLEYRVG